MRITNPTLMRGYNRDLNRVLNLKNQSEHRITTQRKFSRASDAPLSAAKALNVRKSQYYSTQHQENLKVAAKFYTEAETSLIQVSEQMAIIRETIIAACNTTKDYQDLDIYAQQLETKAKELCSIFNTDSAGRAIFGGESDDSMPFAIVNDSDGHAATVTYHGVPVNAMKDYTKFPYSNDVNVDIGLGMAVDQETHEIDPDSVLKISFNGPEVSGCGAERGVADVDLSSIQESRTYSLLVYAGDVKKEITFTGKATQAENVAEINRLLQYEYRKEITAGNNYPEMDAQGVISLRDAMGDAVDGGVVSVVNNPYPAEKHTSQLVVDNDSNYTNKYRLSLSELKEGKTYKLDVELGTGEKKTIEFEAGADNLSDPNAPIYREDITVQNFQKALDEAFGEGVVNISPNDPTKGIVTSEGTSVKLNMSADSNKEEITSAYELANITTSSTPVTETNSLNLAKLERGKTYVINATIGTETKKITFEAGKTVSDTKTAIAKAFDKEFVDSNGDPLGKLKIDNSGKFTYTKNGTTSNVKLEEATAGTGETAIDLGETKNYKIDLTTLEDGKEYSLKFIVGNKMENITFTAGADAAANKTAIQTALDTAFGTANYVTVADDGTVASANGAVTVSNNPSPDKNSEKVFERECAYSYNYIQLTLDAARALRSGDIEY
ncbi:MAG: flagellin, partial [Oscillospiraceae bacterium]